MSLNRRKILSMIAGSTVALGAAAGSSVIATSGAAGTTPWSQSRVADIAQAAAARDGDATPALIQDASTTREMANAIAGGDVVPGTRPSYLIAIRGHFTVATDAPPLPPMALNSPTTATQTETYSVMTLVVDAGTGQVTDFGLSNTYPDIGRLGVVRTDYTTAGRVGLSSRAR
jgi:hypothetical protein